MVPDAEEKKRRRKLFLLALGAIWGGFTCFGAVMMMEGSVGVSRVVVLAPGTTVELACLTRAMSSAPGLTRIRPGEVNVLADSARLPRGFSFDAYPSTVRQNPALWIRAEGSFGPGKVLKHMPVETRQQLEPLVNELTQRLLQACVPPTAIVSTRWED